MKIKKHLNYLGEEMVYGGHLLSLGGVSIALVTAFLLGIKTSPGFYLIIYLGFQAIYLFNRYREFFSDRLTNPERTGHLQSAYRRIPRIVFIWLLIFFVILIYFQKTPAFLFGIFTISLGLLYSVFIKKFTGRIPGLKGIFVAACWSTVVVFLILYYEQPFTWAVVLLVIFVFLRWVVNTTVFDVKDMVDDQRKEIITLPIFLGREKSIAFLKAVTLISTIPIFIGVYLKILPLTTLLLLFTVPYAFYYLNRIKEKNNDSFTYNVIIDGEFVLWSALIIIGTFWYGNA